MFLKNISTWTCKMASRTVTILLLIFYVDFSQGSVGLTESKNTCHPQALALRRVQELPVQAQVTATAILRARNKGYFVCVAVLDRLGESDILCQFVETQEKVVERHKYETRGHVEGTVDELHVVNRRNSSALVAVVRNGESVLFLCYFHGSTGLNLVPIGYVGSVASSHYSAIQNENRTIILSPSTSTCLAQPGTCQALVPSVDLLVGTRLATCVSSEHGVSSAVGAWTNGSDFLIAHALHDSNDDSSTILKVFRLKSSVSLAHCRLEAVSTVRMKNICGVRSMKIIRTWGQRYLLISSNKCSGNYDITTGSNRNTISLFWDPEKSRFEMDSLTELPETALVSNILTVSASIFMLVRPPGYPTQLYCSNVDLTKRSKSTPIWGKFSVTKVAEMYRTNSPTSTAVSAYNNNHGQVYIARATEKNSDVERGRCMATSTNSVCDAVIDIDRLECTGSRSHRENGSSTSYTRPRKLRRPAPLGIFRPHSLGTEAGISNNTERAIHHNVPQGPHMFGPDFHATAQHVLPLYSPAKSTVYNETRFMDLTDSLPDPFLSRFNLGVNYSLPLASAYNVPALQYPARPLPQTVLYINNTPNLQQSRFWFGDEEIGHGAGNTSAQFQPAFGLGDAAHTGYGWPEPQRSDVNQGLVASMPVLHQAPPAYTVDHTHWLASMEDYDEMQSAPLTSDQMYDHRHPLPVQPVASGPPFRAPVITHPHADPQTEPSIIPTQKVEIQPGIFSGTSSADGPSFHPIDYEDAGEYPGRLGTPREDLLASQFGHGNLHRTFHNKSVSQPAFQVRYNESGADDRFLYMEKPLHKPAANVFPTTSYDQRIPATAETPRSHPLRSAYESLLTNELEDLEDSLTLALPGKIPQPLSTHKLLSGIQATFDHAVDAAFRRRYGVDGVMEEERPQNTRYIANSTFGPDQNPPTIPIVNEASRVHILGVIHKTAERIVDAAFQRRYNQTDDTGGTDRVRFNGIIRTSPNPSTVRPDLASSVRTILPDIHQTFERVLAAAFKRRYNSDLSAPNDDYSVQPVISPYLSADRGQVEKLSAVVHRAMENVVDNAFRLRYNQSIESEILKPGQTRNYSTFGSRYFTDHHVDAPANFLGKKGTTGFPPPDMVVHNIVNRIIVAAFRRRYNSTFPPHDIDLLLVEPSILAVDRQTPASTAELTHPAAKPSAYDDLEIQLASALPGDMVLPSKTKLQPLFFAAVHQTAHRIVDAAFKKRYNQPETEAHPARLRYNATIDTDSETTANFPAFLDKPTTQQISRVLHATVNRVIGESMEPVVPNRLNYEDVISAYEMERIQDIFLQALPPAVLPNRGIAQEFKRFLYANAQRIVDAAFRQRFDALALEAQGNPPALIFPASVRMDSKSSQTLLRGFGKTAERIILAVSKKRYDHFDSAQLQQQRSHAQHLATNSSRLLPDSRLRYNSSLDFPDYEPKKPLDHETKRTVSAAVQHTVGRLLDGAFSRRYNHTLRVKSLLKSAIRYDDVLDPSEYVQMQQHLLDSLPYLGRIDPAFVGEYATAVEYVGERAADAAFKRRRDYADDTPEQKLDQKNDVDDLTRFATGVFVQFPYFSETTAKVLAKTIRTTADRVADAAFKWRYNQKITSAASNVHYQTVKHDEQTPPFGNDSQSMFREGRLAEIIQPEIVAQTVSETVATVLQLAFRQRYGYSPSDEPPVEHRISGIKYEDGLDQSDLEMLKNTLIPALPPLDTPTLASLRAFGKGVRLAAERMEKAAFRHRFNTTGQPGGKVVQEHGGPGTRLVFLFEGLPEDVSRDLSAALYRTVERVVNAAFKKRYDDASAEFAGKGLTSLRLRYNVSVDEESQERRLGYNVPTDSEKVPIYVIEAMERVVDAAFRQRYNYTQPGSNSLGRGFLGLKYEDSIDTADLAEILQHNIVSVLPLVSKISLPSKEKFSTALQVVSDRILTSAFRRRFDHKEDQRQRPERLKFDEINNDELSAALITFSVLPAPVNVIANSLINTLQETAERIVHSAFKERYDHPQLQLNSSGSAAAQDFRQAQEFGTDQLAPQISPVVLHKSIERIVHAAFSRRYNYTVNPFETRLSGLSHEDGLDDVQSQILRNYLMSALPPLEHVSLSLQKNFSNAVVTSAERAVDTAFRRRHNHSAFAQPHLDGTQLRRLKYDEKDYDELHAALLFLRFYPRPAATIARTLVKTLHETAERVVEAAFKLRYDNQRPELPVGVNTVEKHHAEPLARPQQGSTQHLTSDFLSEFLHKTMGRVVDAAFKQRYNYAVPGQDLLPKSRYNSLKYEDSLDVFDSKTLHNRLSSALPSVSPVSPTSAQKFSAIMREIGERVVDLKFNHTAASDQSLSRSRSERLRYDEVSYEKLKLALVSFAHPPRPVDEIITTNLMDALDYTAQEIIRAGDELQEGRHHRRLNGTTDSDSVDHRSAYEHPQLHGKPAAQILPGHLQHTMDWVVNAAFQARYNYTATDAELPSHGSPRNHAKTDGREFGEMQKNLISALPFVAPGKFLQIGVLSSTIRNVSGRILGAEFRARFDSDPHDSGLQVQRLRYDEVDQETLRVALETLKVPPQPAESIARVLVQAIHETAGGIVEAASKGRYDDLRQDYSSTANSIYFDNQEAQVPTGHQPALSRQIVSDVPPFFLHETMDRVVTAAFRKRYNFTASGRDPSQSHFYGLRYEDSLEDLVGEVLQNRLLTSLPSVSPISEPSARRFFETLRQTGERVADAAFQQRFNHTSAIDRPLFHPKRGRMRYHEVDHEVLKSALVTFARPPPPVDDILTENLMDVLYSTAQEIISATDSVQERSRRRRLNGTIDSSEYRLPPVHGKATREGAPVYLQDTMHRVISSAFRQRYNDLTADAEHPSYTISNLRYGDSIDASDIAEMQSDLISALPSDAFVSPVIVARLSHTVRDVSDRMMGVAFRERFDYETALGDEPRLPRLKYTEGDYDALKTVLVTFPSVSPLNGEASARSLLVTLQQTAERIVKGGFRHRYNGTSLSEIRFRDQTSAYEKTHSASPRILPFELPLIETTPARNNGSLPQNTVGLGIDHHEKAGGFGDSYFNGSAFRLRYNSSTSMDKLPSIPNVRNSSADVLNPVVPSGSPRLNILPSIKEESARFLDRPTNETLRPSLQRPSNGSQTLSRYNNTIDSQDSERFAYASPSATRFDEDQEVQKVQRFNKTYYSKSYPDIPRSDVNFLSEFDDYTQDFGESWKLNIRPIAMDDYDEPVRVSRLITSLNHSFGVDSALFGGNLLASPMFPPSVAGYSRFNSGLISYNGTLGKSDKFGPIGRRIHDNEILPETNREPVPHPGLLSHAPSPDRRHEAAKPIAGLVDPSSERIIRILNFNTDDAEEVLQPVGVDRVPVMLLGHHSSGPNRLKQNASSAEEFKHLAAVQSTQNITAMNDPAFGIRYNESVDMTDSDIHPIVHPANNATFRDLTSPSSVSNGHLNILNRTQSGSQYEESFGNHSLDGYPWAPYAGNASFPRVETAPNSGIRYNDSLNFDEEVDRSVPAAFGESSRGTNHLLDRLLLGDVFPTEGDVLTNNDSQEFAQSPQVTPANVTDEIGSVISSGRKPPITSLLNNPNLYGIKRDNYLEGPYESPEDPLPADKTNLAPPVQEPPVPERQSYVPRGRALAEPDYYDYEEAPPVPQGYYSSAAHSAQFMNKFSGAKMVGERLSEKQHPPFTVSERKEDYYLQEPVYKATREPKAKVKLTIKHKKVSFNDGRGGNNGEYDSYASQYYPLMSTVVDQAETMHVPPESRDQQQQSRKQSIYRGGKQRATGLLPMAPTWQREKPPQQMANVSEDTNKRSGSVSHLTIDASSKSKHTNATGTADLLKSVVNILLGNKTEDRNVTSGRGQLAESIQVNMTSVGGEESATMQSLKLKLVRRPKHGPFAIACRTRARFTTRDIVKHINCAQDVRDTPITVPVHGGSGSFYYEISNVTRRDDVKFVIDHRTGEVFSKMPLTTEYILYNEPYIIPERKYVIPLRVSDELCDTTHDATVAITFVCIPYRQYA